MGAYHPAVRITASNRGGRDRCYQSQSKGNWPGGPLAYLRRGRGGDFFKARGCRILPTTAGSSIDGTT